MQRPAPDTTLQIAASYSDGGDLVNKLRDRFGLRGKPYILAGHYTLDLYWPLSQAVRNAGFDYDGDYDSIDYYEARGSGGWSMDEAGRMTYTYNLVVTVTFGEKP